MSGIRRRVERAGGKVRTISGIGEGFQIYINLPLRDRESAERQIKERGIL